MRRGIVLLFVPLVLLLNCARHKDQRSVSGISPQAQTAAGPSAGTFQPAAVATYATPPGEPEPPRPSPFSDFREADRQEVASSSTPATSSTTSSSAVSTPQKAHESPAAHKTLKAFVPKPDDLPNAQGSRDRVAALPPPPPLPAIPARTVAPAATTRVACCVSTAFLEPAKPPRLQRMFHKVPGLGRIRQYPESQEGFVAARPKSEIVLVLPPEARATLRDGRMDLKATVDDTGRVTRVELLAPKDEELVRLASYAAGDWPFTPARINDKAVPSEVILHFNFSGN